ncbi:MAG: FapA family protein [Oscillospiraceae bacterium]|nr:FapA family protein [Oscillospiraceae bacterium]
MSNENETAFEERASFPPPSFSFVIAQDKMTAYLRVGLQHRDQRVTKDEIMAAVASNGIVFGVDEAEIESFAEGDNMLRELRVASGERPVKGEDGSVELNYVLGNKGKPKERDDGTVDFKDLEIVNNVSVGDVIFKVHLPTEGIDGKDVFGAVVKAKPGNMPSVPGGDKVSLSDDGTAVISRADGNLSIRGDVVFIDEIFKVDDVGVETGNIDFNGAVIINGSVHEGFSVRAKSDITINGIVEGATVHSGGNLLVKLGINGMNKADIFAEGNITSGFIESATVKCGGNLFADTILNSRVKVGEVVRLRGKRGALLGGECVAGEAINVKTIGSDKHIRQDVSIRPRWYEYEKSGAEEMTEDPGLTVEVLTANRAKLLERANKISVEVAKLQRPVREYEKPMSAAEKTAKMRELITEKTKFSTAISAIDKDLQRIKAMFEGHDFKVVCLGECFPGVRVQIGNIHTRIEVSTQNQTMRVDQGEITYSAVMSHERS